MKNVMLKIEGTQQSFDGEANSIELVTEGKLYQKENALYLVYQESEISGMEGCTTTLKVVKDKISMRRFGTAHSEIVFEKGKRFSTRYQTPYGDFDMEIITMEMESSISDLNKGDINIEYNVSLRGMMESQNTLNIRIM